MTQHRFAYPSDPYGLSGCTGYMVIPLSSLAPAPAFAAIPGHPQMAPSHAAGGQPISFAYRPLPMMGYGVATDASRGWHEYGPQYVNIPMPPGPIMAFAHDCYAPKNAANAKVRGAHSASLALHTTESSARACARVALRPHATRTASYPCRSQARASYAQQGTDAVVTRMLEQAKAAASAAWASAIPMHEQMRPTAEPHLASRPELKGAPSRRDKSLATLAKELVRM